LLLNNLRFWGVFIYLFIIIIIIFELKNQETFLFWVLEKFQRTVHFQEINK
jgi:hypothetical protein